MLALLRRADTICSTLCSLPQHPLVPRQGRQDWLQLATLQCLLPAQHLRPITPDIWCVQLVLLDDICPFPTKATQPTDPIAHQMVLYNRQSDTQLAQLLLVPCNGSSCAEAILTLGCKGIQGGCAESHQGTAGRQAECQGERGR